MTRLVLTRKAGEEIYITVPETNDEIVLQFPRVDRKGARVAITARKDIKIVRSELRVKREAI